MFNRTEQHFASDQDELPLLTGPLTVTLQVTRGCNLRCIYCSESEFVQAPTLPQVEAMVDNLSGVTRLIVSGGEPTLRKDLEPILERCRDRFQIVALASNATRINHSTAEMLSRYVDYVDVTIDGPRAIHNAIRGSYDQVIEGLWNLKRVGLEFSVVMVLLAQNEGFVPYVVHAADLLGAKKLKILTPIPKGRGKLLGQGDLPQVRCNQLFGELRDMKQRLGWRVRITITDWPAIGEGHALLIHPNGDVVASPVWSNESCVENVGNVLVDPIGTIWARYRFKENHVRKYLERTLMVC